MIEVYTDGSCLGNPGPGGFGYVIHFNGHEVTGGAGYPKTTNNQMELMAVLHVMKALSQAGLTGESVVVRSDSKYVVDAFNKDWISGWKRRNWKNARGEAVANQEIWKLLLPLTDKIKPKFVYVKGHAGHKYNEMCDQLAKHYAERANKDGITIIE